MAEEELSLCPLVPYTTRPIRSDEEEGKQYHFCTDQQADEMLAQGKVIEMRIYHTIHGDWRYFTADDGQIDLKEHNYLLIGTLEVLEQLVRFFGKEYVIPVYIWIEDGLRLSRALERERFQQEPHYAELCRRYLADEADFSEENCRQHGITKKFENRMLQETVHMIKEYMMEQCEE